MTDQTTTHQEMTMTTDQTAGLDDQLCSSEFPGDDLFVGQLCERERGHNGDHEHVAVIEGTRYSRRLTWPAEVTR